METITLAVAVTFDPALVDDPREWLPQWVVGTMRDVGVDARGLRNAIVVVPPTVDDPSWHVTVGGEVVLNDTREWEVIHHVIEALAELAGRPPA